MANTKPNATQVKYKNETVFSAIDRAESNILTNSNNSVRRKDYTELIAYTGQANLVSLVNPDVFGDFALSPANPSVIPNGVTVFRLADGRIARRQYSGKIDPRWAGVVGDYVTDDTVAFKKVCEVSSELNEYVDFSGMNVRVTGSYDLPENVGLYADKSHNINTWLDTTDRLNMRPGYKHLVSGGNIWISGTGRNTYTTNRTDRFASFTYGLSYLHLQAMRWQGVGLILDVDIYDASGVMTSRVNDNQSACDVGLLMRGYASKGRFVNFFGYWGIGSTLVHSQQDFENVDSDYFGFSDSRFTGIYLVGDSTGSNGLTGSSWPGCEFYNSADYHVREEGNYNNASIFVDGVVTGTEGVRGHNFGGVLRTYANNAVVLDHARQIRIDLHSAETPIISGVAGADTQGNIVGTSNTGAVYVGPVSSSANSLGINTLAATIKGPLIAVGGNLSGQIIVARNGRSIRTQVVSGTGDQTIQMTEDLNSDTSGLVIARDASNSGRLSIRFDNNEAVRIDSIGNLQADGIGRFDTGLTITSGTSTVGGPITHASGELDLRGFSGSGVRLRSGSNTVLLSDTTITRPGLDKISALGATNSRWTNTFSVNIRPGAGNVIWTSGSGTPEGGVVAPVGSMYTRTDGSTGTTLYIKESGVGNTGWVAK